MSNADSITYTCRNCGWANTWTRDEIARLKFEVVYRDDYEEYSLPCKNPTLRPPCPERRKIAISRQKG